MSFVCRYDIKGFADDLGLPLSEVAGLYTDLVCEINGCLSELKVLIPQKDWEAVKRIIHNIKGISANYRITDLYQQSEKIYDALKAGHSSGIESSLEPLNLVAQEAVGEIRRFFDQNGISFPV